MSTPAIGGGRVFVGGGFGTHDFYAFDAIEGGLEWHYRTRDDGPTAAAVLGDFVAFNTESCDLEVLTLGGAQVWKRRLGDPLISMPALTAGRVFQAYPDGRDHRCYLGSFDLRTGAPQWSVPLASDVITAPVLDEQSVYVSTLGGTIYCLNQESGAVVWEEKCNATSSPSVWHRRCYFSQRDKGKGERDGQSMLQAEHITARATAGEDSFVYAATQTTADYLDHDKRRRFSLRDRVYSGYDSSVGFSGHKGDVHIADSIRNLGHSHVSGLWSFQGSKPFVAGGSLFAAIGDSVYRLDPEGEGVHWKRRVHETRDDSDRFDHVLTPPAVVNGKVFVAGLHGDLHCLAADTGETIWHTRVDEPIQFQPAVALGRVYVGTAGSLICLETGDPADDGWLMWGATAAHNGVAP